ncbi:MAG: hypothetical protein LBS19_08275, partial [Clostridiales bacterium]|jgi:nucleoside-diphosphate-sugar epimerase|nr:hypothetical protein [Clostridiales bacterium]
MIDVRDAALALRLLGQAERLTGREYYIGSGRAKPLREWFIEAREALGTEAALAFDKRPDDGLRFDKSWFDISALETDTGFMPRVSFSTAVNELADWLNKKIGSGLYDNH